MELYMKVKHASDVIQNHVRTKYYQLFETKEAIKKRSLYETVVWSREQQEDFDVYWYSLLGKKISSRWHRLYQSYNGIFCKQYIPEMLYTAYIEPRMNDRRYGIVFGNKIITRLLFNDEYCEFPNTLASSDGRNYYDHNNSIISQNRFDKILSNAGKIVIKPATSYGSGQGIVFLNMQDGFDTKTGESIATIRSKLISSEVIAQQYLEQHDDLAAICPNSVNTIRISTYIVGDEVHYSPIALRCGNGTSKLDNIHAGGYGVAVDDSGEVGGIAYRIGPADFYEKTDKHPVTNKVFSQCRITNISNVIYAACSLHGRLPHIGIIGWDFSINQAGKPVIIEANFHGNGIWFPQIIHGKCFFRDDTERVLASVGLLKG